MKKIKNYNIMSLLATIVIETYNWRKINMHLVGPSPNLNSFLMYLNSIILTYMVDLNPSGLWCIKLECSMKKFISNKKTGHHLNQWCQVVHCQSYNFQMASGWDKHALWPDGLANNMDCIHKIQWKRGQMMLGCKISMMKSLVQ